MRFAQHAMITAPNACPGTRIYCSVNLAKLNSHNSKSICLQSWDCVMAQADSTCPLTADTRT